MGLESATYVADVDIANPLAGDRKNQGDDHLRLLKSVLKNTFPNADRAYRFPEIVIKSANYSILATDENKSILADTSAGAFTLTLPTPAFDGWLVRVVKTSTDVNPVYVAPPSGTINGFAKIRCNVPFVEYTFFYTGSSFIRLKGVGEEAPGALIDFGGSAAPVGFAFPAGQLIVAADHPELFAAWGYTWGGSGANFNVPNLLDKFITQAGSSYALGATGGEATHTLLEAEMPSHFHTSNFNSGDRSADPTPLPFGTTVIPVGGGAGVTVLTPTGGSQSITNAHTHIVNGNTDSNGSGTAHENRPPYTALNRIFRLC